MTQRVYDANGWFEVPENPLTCVGVFPYTGASIGSGADPNRIYNVLRPAEELSDPEALNSFRLLPLIDEHEMLGGHWGVDAGKRQVSGMTGENFFFRDGMVYGNLKVISEQLAEQIEGGKRELSVGYRCIYERASGVYNGQEYDFIQRSIRGNHVALVDAGRMGKEVAVLDSADFIYKPKDKNAMSKALKTHLAKVKGLAKDFMAAMDELDVDVGDEDLDENGNPKKAEDEENDDGKKAEDEDLDENGNPKKAEDEDEPKKEASGMDSAVQKQIRSLRKQVADLTADRVTMDSVIQNTAKRDDLAARVRQHIGTFDHSRMTFDGALQYVNTKLGLKAPKGQEETAINAYLLAKSPAVALDSANPSRKKSSSVDKYLSGGK